MSSAVFNREDLAVDLRMAALVLADLLSVFKTLINLSRPRLAYERRRITGRRFAIYGLFCYEKNILPPLILRSTLFSKNSLLGIQLKKTIVF